jgi:hypothetical protein
VTGLGPGDVAEVLRLAVQQAAPGWRLAGEFFEAVCSTAALLQHDCTGYESSIVNCHCIMPHDIICP